MELDNNTMKFMNTLGNAMDALEATWPDHINVTIVIESHGEDIATWGSVEGETVWHFREDSEARS